MALPRILICDEIVWAHQELEELLGTIADLVWLDSPDRKCFLAGFRPGGKYKKTVGIYQNNESHKRIGTFDHELIQGLPSSVKWITHNGAGYDSIDIHACKVKDIYVSNTPSVVNDATATTALYLLIAALRKFSFAEYSLRQLKWKPDGISNDTRDLTSKTLAILGLGGIGMRVATLANTLSMRIIYHSRHKNTDAPVYCKYFEDVEEMLRQADVLSIHVPLGPETVGLVSERWIRLLKPRAVIINTARGRIIDEKAMISALEDGHLSGVGLDVFPNEPDINPCLLKFDSVTLLPHMGTETKDTRKLMEIRALTNLKDFLTKGRGQDLVKEYKEEI